MFEKLIDKIFDTVSSAKERQIKRREILTKHKESLGTLLKDLKDAKNEIYNMEILKELTRF